MVGQDGQQLDLLGSVLHAGIVGLLHPLERPAHVVALAGLALIAARSKRKAAFAGSAVEVAFAVGLAIGLATLVQGVGETLASDALLAGASVCGLVAAAGVSTSTALTLPVAFLFGIALGLDSPPDAISLGEAMATLTGIACGAVIVLAVMVALAFRMGRVWRGVMLRVAGSWIAAIAILALVVRWGGGL
ncbi:MAG: HupE/UreJ family protein [Bradyrhizobiaceae bacterium]|nr:HupE/UreJ family protein [Bradyrhizobiaceae bacterium]